MRNELGLEVPLKSDELGINIETQGRVTLQGGKKSDAHIDQSLWKKLNRHLQIELSEVMELQ